MSRHRAVKNLNLDEELDDGYGYDDEQDEYEDISPEDKQSMDAGYEVIEKALKPTTSITPKEIKDALWEYYFNVDDSLKYLLDIESKREAAAAKKAAKALQQQQSRKASPVPSRSSTPAAKVKQPATNLRVSQLRADMEGLNLLGSSNVEAASPGSTSPSTPERIMSKEKIVSEIRKKESKPSLSLVVIGHVDAGKSTLMGKLLHQLGVTSDKAIEQQQRQSQKIGKSSFAYAWSLDAMEEERERGVTIDIAIDSFETPHRHFTLIDAPGHRDFIPNMISGASQADVAILVVDGATGAYEKGFEGDGQTREHAILVRGLGVQQLVVAVNKLDTVAWSQERFEAIVNSILPFLTQIGFHKKNVFFVPVSAMSGENVNAPGGAQLTSWYSGKPNLVGVLDQLNVPERFLELPLRLPISNVFRSQSTSTGQAISGRVESGIIQVGERVAILPGSEADTVRAIELDGVSVPYAVAGDNVTVFLPNVDPNYLAVGFALSDTDKPVPTVSSFQARIILFDIKIPIIPGSMFELFHQSREVPAKFLSLESVIDKATGKATAEKPRLLKKHTSALVTIQLLPPNASSTKTPQIPLEVFQDNKAMGRILLRRNGETIGAGIVTQLTS